MKKVLDKRRALTDDGVAKVATLATVAAYSGKGAVATPDRLQPRSFRGGVDCRSSQNRSGLDCQGMEP